MWMMVEIDNKKRWVYREWKERQIDPVPPQKPKKGWDDVLTLHENGNPGWA